jgi:acyl-homoserine-lactone acylase
MASPSLSHFLPRFGYAAAVAGLLSVSGCQLDGHGSDSVPPTTGVVAIKGLAQNVSVRRNNLGMPLIESSTFHDALFTLGYLSGRTGRPGGTGCRPSDALGEPA